MALMDWPFGFSTPVTLNTLLPGEVSSRFIVAEHDVSPEHAEALATLYVLVATAYVPVAWDAAKLPRFCLGPACTFIVPVITAVLA